MKQSLLFQFGNPLERVKNAISYLKDGKGILLVDDENRENEGDLIFPAETITIPQMALMIRECSGIVCLCLTKDKINQLNLSPMVKENTSKFQTAFTVSIEAKIGVTTGVSASDRVTTILTAISPNCTPEQLARPGHIFPLCACPGGVNARNGHTEGTIDLMLLSGHQPAGVLCELTNIDGTMARLPEIIRFANKNDLVVVSIEDIIQYKSNLKII